MDTDTLLEEPFVAREPCTCELGRPECPACRQWAEEHGRRGAPRPNGPSPEEEAERKATLHYFQQKIIAENRTVRRIYHKLHRDGVLSVEDRILLLDTKAILEVHRDQRNLLKYPVRERSPDG